MFAYRTLIASRYIEPTYFVISHYVTRPNTTYLIRTHTSVPNEPEHIPNNAMQILEHLVEFGFAHALTFGAVGQAQHPP